MTDLTHEQVVADFRRTMGKQRDEIGKMMPPGLDDEKGLDRFIRTVLTAVQKNEELLYADRKSLMLSCMRAAQDGLLPDGKESVLNVYNTKVKVWNERFQRDMEEWVPMVQFLPMVYGIIKTLYSTGCVAHIDAAAVYEKDHFRFVRGDDARIEHEPYDGEEEPGSVKAAYVIVRLTNGQVHREVMYRRDIEKVRTCAKTQGVWSKWYDQMAIKSVIKRAAKRLPLDSEMLERVLSHDNDAMGFAGLEDDAPNYQPVTDAPDAATVVPLDPAPTTPAAAALTDDTAEQGSRRLSRMAGILQQRAAVPAASSIDDVPAWEEIPPELRK